MVWKQHKATHAKWPWIYGLTTLCIIYDTHMHGNCPLNTPQTKMSFRVKTMNIHTSQVTVCRLARSLAACSHRLFMVAITAVPRGTGRRALRLDEQILHLQPRVEESGSLIWRYRCHTVWLTRVGDMHKNHEASNDTQTVWTGLTVALLLIQIHPSVWKSGRWTVLYDRKSWCWGLNTAA